MLVAIEGIDQAGKATQANLLSEYLTTNVGCDNTILSFPDYNTPAGKIIEQALEGDLEISPYEMQLMHVATRYHWKGPIEEALEDGFIVICDRYTESAVVYGTIVGLDTSWIHQTQSLLPQPDLNIFLDIPVEIALQRKPRNRDKYESDVAFLSKVSSLYRVRTQLQSNWAVVDGTRSVEDVSGDIIKIVKRYRSRK